MKAENKSIQVVIETPKGSVEKYAYKKKTGFFQLKKILPTGMVFPYDFGFIPHTKGQDGDPLDIIVISEFHSFPGIMIECRLVGGFKARQGKTKSKLVKNDRFIAIPLASAIFKDLTDWKNIPETIIKALEDFFINYNKEEGKIFKTTGYLSAAKAFKKIKRQTL
ncbi:inorganic diphosphatase [Pedobacter sp.]|uniref:inorganic diphosphatase n=1 Tax=Pedobacter sp. TaxID=1411316 RepID=UPI00396C832F